MNKPVIPANIYVRNSLCQLSGPMNKTDKIKLTEMKQKDQ